MYGGFSYIIINQHSFVSHDKSLAFLTIPLQERECEQGWLKFDTFGTQFAAIIALFKFPINLARFHGPWPCKQGNTSDAWLGPRDALRCESTASPINCAWPERATTWKIAGARFQIALAPRIWDLGPKKNRHQIIWWYLQSKCFFLGPMSSSVVALHTDFARPWPARLCLAASNLSLIVCPAIFTLILGRGVCTRNGPAQRPTDKSHTFRHRRLWRTAHSALTQLQLPSGAPLTKMASDDSRRTLSAHVTAPPKQIDFQRAMIVLSTAPRSVAINVWSLVCN